MRNLGLFVPFALVLSSGCISAIEGSGIVVDEERDVAPFVGIIVSGDLDVDVQVGKAQRVVLSLDDNLLDLVKTETVDGVLEVRQNEDIAFFGTTEERLTIEVPRLTSYIASGDIKARISGIDTSRFEASLSGDTELIAEGTVTNVDVVASGETIVDASRLEAEHADISASGDSDLAVFASKTLSASLSGSAKLDVYGDPKDEDVRTSGDTAVAYR